MVIKAEDEGSGKIEKGVCGLDLGLVVAVAAGEQSGSQSTAGVGILPVDSLSCWKETKQWRLFFSPVWISLGATGRTGPRQGWFVDF